MHKQAASRRPSSKATELDGLLFSICLTGTLFFLLPSSLCTSLMPDSSRIIVGKFGVSTPLLQVVMGSPRKPLRRLIGHQLWKWRSGMTLYAQQRAQEIFENSSLEGVVLVTPYGTSARTTIYVVRVTKGS